MRDVRMIERRERLRFALNRARRSVSAANASGRTLIATSRLSFVSRRAIHLAHPAFADRRDDFIDAEAGAGSERQSAGLYGGSIAAASQVPLSIYQGRRDYALGDRSKSRSGQ